MVHGSRIIWILFSFIPSYLIHFHSSAFFLFIIWRKNKKRNFIEWERMMSITLTDIRIKSTTAPIFTFVRQSTICSIAYHSATNHALMWKRTQRYWLISETRTRIECQKQKQNIHAHQISGIDICTYIYIIHICTSIPMKWFPVHPAENTRV